MAKPCPAPSNSRIITDTESSVFGSVGFAATWKAEMKKVFATLFLLASAWVIGCTDAETVIPNTPLTEEQKAAIKAEDAAVAKEESGKR